MREYFNTIADEIQSHLHADEAFTSDFGAEDSDFVRFNRNEIRQAGHVTQRMLEIDLISGKRHASGCGSLSGDLETDRPRIARLIKSLRELRSHLPEDPHLLYATEVRSTERTGSSRLPDAAAAVEEIRKAGQGRDLVGIYASGGIHKGFANSFGQRNWYGTHTFNFDWSFYHQLDKAVKTTYAGFEWKPQEFDRKVSWAKEQLEALSHPARTVHPGRYRVYLAPAALYDIVGILNSGGFGLKSHRTKQTPLLKMIEGEVRMHPSVNIAEHTGAGIAANFQEAGFIRPDRVTLIEAGAHRDCLVSPRSAMEYGVPTNGASLMEIPESLEVAPGDLPMERVLRTLETGIYVGNVWYLNYSDRSNCRTTGMTRFATFWVEGARIKAPLNVMRFDETLFRMLGENLVGLTREQDLILDPGTYYQRSTQSRLVPGALVDDFTLTL
ncbi:MAG: TldE/PmbA family protein [Planctomycetes bacterium]|nr:TldE/PmbA family protein [Planctomycetota bacterium]